MEKEFADGVEKEAEEIKTYVSQTGFEIVPILRGIWEIRNLLAILENVEAFICGGYVRFMASPDRNPKPASDIDIYCKNEDVFNHLKNLFTNTHHLTIRHENNMAITFKHPEERSHLLYICPPIQLIKPVKQGRIVAFGDMEEILDNFDFTVIRCGLVNENYALVDKDFMHDESHRIMRLKNIHCPISSTLRCCKYAKKGYWLPPTQALKLFVDWDGRSQEYKQELVEYLVMANEGKGLTQEQVDHLEELMRID